ncbi:MAG TPA: hypothetical protein VF933_07670 [Streptosporangiaceae bacterium]
MANSIPLDERDFAALEAVCSASISLHPVASAALAVALAEALTVQAEACECATSPGDLCARCAELSDRAVDYRELADQLSTCLGRDGWPRAQEVREYLAVLAGAAGPGEPG